MAKKHHHIQIGGQPWCDWTGTQAGRDINQKAGDVTCGHVSAAAAQRGARALRAHFRRGAVKVVAGDCQHAQTA